MIKTISCSYDENDRLLSASDGVSSYEYAYDVIGRTVSVSNDGTTGVPTVVLTNDYDGAGQRSLLSATVGAVDYFVNGYSYDALGRLTGLSQSGVTGGNTVASKLFEFAYNSVGNLTSIERYSDLAGTQAAPATISGYDSARRLTSLTHKQGTTDIAACIWTYDDEGRITGMTSPDGSTAYTYDDNGQLTLADHSTDRQCS